MLRWLLLALAATAAADDFYDVVVYGGTSAGVMAAIQSSKMGKTTVLIEPGLHLGGMTSSGLGYVDGGNPEVLGGLSREFFHRIWAYYQNKEAWVWETPRLIKGQFVIGPPPKTMWVAEPHVAELIFEEMIQQAGVTVERVERLDREKGVWKESGKLMKIAMESGLSIRGNVFIDASYEGDLMAAAKVSYRVGREANSEYGETLNGIRPNPRRSDLPKKKNIDPYRFAGDPSSGLLPRVHPHIGGAAGDADQGVQSYNYRLCMTSVPENRIFVEQPEGYDEGDYEIVIRAIRGGLPREKFLKLDLIPNGKTDTNNYSSVSTDFVGMSWDYAESSYAERDAIAAAHENWIRGLIWTLQNHPRVHEKVRTYYAPWGLAKDEFLDNNHWPRQLYVREARRMVSDTVITEHIASGNVKVSDPIAFASYPMDSHAVKYYVAPDGFIMTDGALFKGIEFPFPISYGAIVPKKGECENLLVPVCLSASHVAYGSIRMEPVLMVLGQAAGAAASLAIDRSIPVQELSYEKLRESLLKEGLILKLP